MVEQYQVEPYHFELVLGEFVGPPEVAKKTCELESGKSITFVCDRRILAVYKIITERVKC